MRCKAYLLTLWLFFVCAALGYAQPQLALNGGLGISQIDDQLYFTTSVYPDIAIGSLGIGLEFTLNFDHNGMRKADWETTEKALSRSIRYIRWGYKGGPLYLQFGQLHNSTIGTGILVSNYMNTSTADIRSDNRHLGLIADVALETGGVESMVNDVLQPNLYAIRLYVRPASVMPTLADLQQLTVGVSAADDKRLNSPYNGLTATAIDAYYPIHPAFQLYAHTAHIDDHGSGQGLGFRGVLGPINYLAELRRFDADFVPSPFSHGYESNGIDWSLYPPNGPRTEGYLLGAGLNLLGGDLALSLQQERNLAAPVSAMPRLTAGLTAQGGLMQYFAGGRPGILSATYTQEVVDPQQGDANGYLKATAQVALMQGVNLNYTYNVAYPHNSEPQRYTAVGVTFGF